MTFLGYLVQLLSYLVVKKNFLLQLKLPLEIGKNKFFQRFLLYISDYKSVQSMLWHFCCAFYVRDYVCFDTYPILSTACFK